MKLISFFGVSHLQASLEGTVSALRNENEFHIQKEVT